MKADFWIMKPFSRPFVSKDPIIENIMERNTPSSEGVCFEEWLVWTKYCRPFKACFLSTDPDSVFRLH